MVISADDIIAAQRRHLHVLDVILRVLKGAGGASDGDLNQIAVDGDVDLLGAVGSRDVESLARGVEGRARQQPAAFQSFHWIVQSGTLLRRVIIPAAVVSDDHAKTK